MIHYAYAEGTVEEAVAARVVARMAGLDAMVGEDTGLLDALTAALGRDRLLPPSE